MRLPHGMEEFRSADQSSYGLGEDTWYSALLSRIEKWETKNSEPGAVRLDLVITDGVFEHAKDLTECNRIQERRDGSLQTVFLNFLSMDEWSDTKLPRHCVQYLANVDNIAGLSRTVLHEFVSSYM